MKKTPLCEVCASEQGVTNPDAFSIGDTNPAKPSKPGEAKPPKLKLPMGEETIELPAPAGQHPAAICPGCGFAFDDLKKTGRLGCSQCYQFFRTEIKHNLGGMHKGTSHTGRVPEGMLEAFEKRQRLEQLQQDMDEAIAAEDYEKAATLRDEINTLSMDQPVAKDA